MLADYHVHTEFSDDSVYPMEQVVRDAIGMGMEEICFTDHVDYPRYFAEIRKLRQKYSVQTHTIPKYEELFGKYPLDFVILSIHQVEDKEFWTQDFQKGRSQKEYNERYYEEMLNVVRAYKNYSVLGHMDLITRYDENGYYPFEKSRPIVEDILKTVIEDGKGIEFNTSYHRYGLKDTTPSVDILKLYKRLGGEIITIGSDSHRREHLGAYIREAGQLLKDLGFRFLCIYDRMKPIYCRL